MQTISKPLPTVFALLPCKGHDPTTFVALVFHLRVTPITALSYHFSSAIFPGRELWKCKTNLQCWHSIDIRPLPSSSLAIKLFWGYSQLPCCSTYWTTPQSLRLVIYALEQVISKIFRWLTHNFSFLSCLHPTCIQASQQIHLQRLPGSTHRQRQRRPAAANK